MPNHKGPQPPGALASAGFCLALAAAVAGPAHAETSSIVVAQVDGNAPGDVLPVSMGKSSGGPGVPRSNAVAGVQGLRFPGQLDAVGEADVRPGAVHVAGHYTLNDRGQGSVGSVTVQALGSTRDVITIQGAPAQVGQHLKLNGSLKFFADLRPNPTGVASSDFPNPPGSTGFADADSRIVFSLASTGVAGGVAHLAESRRGIDNEHGKTFDVDTPMSGAIPFSLDIIVGKPTEISFLAEMVGTGSIADFTGTPFGDDGDVARTEANFGGEVDWSSDTAFLTDAVTGRRMHGLSLTSDSGFDWLGDGEGPPLPAPAPEPGSWLLMIVGLGLTGAALRRRSFLHLGGENGMHA